jgi:hypothetical protein
MGFAERQLKFTFSGAPGFSGAPTGTFSAQGLRAAVNVQAFQDRSVVMAQAKIYGLSLAQMTAYSSQIPGAPSGPAGLVPFNLLIEAGDAGGTMAKVVNGQIWRSYIDLSGAPESCLSVSVAGTLYQSAATIGSQSWAGAQNAEDLIQSICPEALPRPMTLHNNGAHAVLRNPSTSGSAIDQIMTLALAAKFLVIFDGDDVYIWPPGGTRDTSPAIAVGPDTDPGMVGYPEFWQNGIIVTSLYNPSISVGRQIQVSSSIPNAQGTWSIIQVQHELTTMLSKGPWFTTAVLAPPGSSVTTQEADNDDNDNE